MKFLRLIAPSPNEKHLTLDFTKPRAFQDPLSGNYGVTFIRGTYEDTTGRVHKLLSDDFVYFRSSGSVDAYRLKFEVGLDYLSKWAIQKLMGFQLYGNFKMALSNPMGEENRDNLTLPYLNRGGQDLLFAIDSNLNIQHTHGIVPHYHLDTDPSHLLLIYYDNQDMLRGYSDIEQIVPDSRYNGKAVAVSGYSVSFSFCEVIE